ncbi:DNA-(apurinic or apyrimidinic site) lyase 2 [Chelonia mydas]|uniref:exodeoxyribonuclease III n=1 Tax=Chelonia mydas TaxID=8469 RepID=M7AVA5_CHEMY|nr:DNA-(apurinic or apyrimidinic site) lyase 2 [Chelonia mydas]
MHEEFVLPYYTADCDQARGLMNTAMGPLQRQLRAGEYEIFQYAPIFESDFIQSWGWHRTPGFSLSPLPGVATFCKDSATPLAAEEGLSGLLAQPGEGGAVGCYGDLGAFTPQELKALDSEGRAVITHHRIRHVVILGDINTSHRPIDHCEPGDLEAFQEHPGRRWLDGFLWVPDGPPGQGLFVDTFRLLHPSQPYAFTCWRVDTGARLTNHGTRLDYVLADRALALAELRDARVLPEEFHPPPHA